MSKLLTIKEVAKRLCISKSTVGFLLREGKIRGIKVSERRWVVEPEDLGKYINERFNQYEGEKEKKPSFWKTITPDIYFVFVPVVLAFLVGVLVGGLLL